MYAVGDKVFYKGRINRFNRVDAQIVRKYINGFLYVEGQVGRFNASSFVKLNGIQPIDKPVDLLAELTVKANKSNGGTCHYALEFDNGHKRFQVSDVCHARMPFDSTYLKDPREKVLKAVALNVSEHLKRVRNKDAYKAFVKYIIQDSPWKNAFIPKDIEEVYTSGVYIDITKDYWYCVAAAIALRVGSEYENKLPLFNQIIELGFSTHVAFIVSQFSYNNGNEVQLTKHAGGHHVINNVDVTTAQFSNFFKGILHKQAGFPYHQANGKGYTIQKMIGERRMEEKSVFDDVVKTLENHVTITKRPWGESGSYIDLGDMKKLVVVCNYFEKVIK